MVRRLRVLLVLGLCIVEALWLGISVLRRRRSVALLGLSIAGMMVLGAGLLVVLLLLILLMLVVSLLSFVVMGSWLVLLVVLWRRLMMVLLLLLLLCGPLLRHSRGLVTRLLFLQTL